MSWAAYWQGVVRPYYNPQIHEFNKVIALVK